MAPVERIASLPRALFAALSAAMVAALAASAWSAETPANGDASPWREDFAAAIASDGKPLALLMSIPDCTWCQRMLEESAASPEVRRALSDVVGIHVHADVERALTAQLGVESFPTLVLVNRKRELVRVVPGYLSPLDLATALRVLALHGDTEGSGKLDLGAPVDVAALGSDPDGLRTLVALLGSGGIEQRSAVRKALAGMPQAIDLLWVALADDRLGVRVDAAAALAALTCQPPGYDPFSAPELRESSIAAWRAAAAVEVAP